MPSKALLRSGAALAAARRVPGAAEAITGELDVAAVLKRRDEIVSDYDDGGQVEWLESAGIDLRPRIRSDHRPQARVGHRGGRHGDRADRDVTPSRSATGTAALLPDIAGLADVAAMDEPRGHRRHGGARVASPSSAAASSPARWRPPTHRFGTTVTVIARSGLLGGMEPFAGELVAEALREGRGRTCSSAHLHLGPRETPAAPS